MEKEERRGIIEEGIRDKASTAGEGEEASLPGIVRKARFDDLEAIMDINRDVHQGLDYFPAMFHHFLHSKLHSLYVYEEDGKAIGVLNFRIRPDEEDLITGLSGRVRPSHEGRGIVTSYRSPIGHRMLEDHPGVTRYIGNAMNKREIQRKTGLWEFTYISNCLVYKIVDRLPLDRFLRLQSRQGTCCPQPITVTYSQGLDWIASSDQLIQFLARYTHYIPHTPLWIHVSNTRTGLRELFALNNVRATFGSPTAENQSKTTENQSKTTENQSNSKTTENQSKTTENQSKTTENQSKTTENQSKTTENQSKATENQSEITENQSETTENQSKTTENQSKTTENQSKTTENQSKTAENQSKNSSELLGFSHSSVYQCPFGVCVVINFFGDDVTVCVSHVVGHLRHYVDVVSDDVSVGCYLHFPRTIDAKTVEERLREGLGQRVENDYYDVTEAAHFTVRMRYAKL